MALLWSRKKTHLHFVISICYSSFSLYIVEYLEAIWTRSRDKSLEIITYTFSENQKNHVRIFLIAIYPRMKHQKQPPRQFSNKLFFFFQGHIIYVIYLCVLRTDNFFPEGKFVRRKYEIFRGRLFSSSRTDYNCPGEVSVPLIFFSSTEMCN